MLPSHGGKLRREHRSNVHKADASSHTLDYSTVAPRKVSEAWMAMLHVRACCALQGTICHEAHVILSTLEAEH
jgi:hypothetical protein